MKKSKQATTLEREIRGDMISNLPDHILYLILPRLQTTEEVVRTSILSRRWRYLWTSIPFIDIDCSRRLKRGNEFDINKFEEFVNRVSANKSVDLDCFRLCCSNYYDLSAVGRWILAALMRNVKLIDLKFCSKEEDEHEEVLEVPECPVRCDFLEELRLTMFNCSLNLPYLSELKAVRVLELNKVELSYYGSCEWFTQLINLEEPSLIDCWITYSNFSECLKLKNLRLVNKVDENPHPGEITMYCPNLEFLEIAGLMAYLITLDIPNPLKKAVIHREDMLEGLLYFDFFGSISRVESLSIGLPFLLQFIKKEGFFPSLPDLKTLEITTTIGPFTLDIILQFLIHPNLESLHLIIQEDTFGFEYWKLDDTETMKILTRHLKRVEFVKFDEEDSKLDIARSLLEHGNALEEIVFSWDNKDDYHKMSMETMKKVSTFHKVSSIVKLIALLKD